MAERFVYSTGTISIVTGDDVVTGTGTAWSGRDRAGSQIWAVLESGDSVRIGTVAEVDPRGIYDDLELPLVQPYNGGSIVGAAYELIDGPAIANGATQAAIYARFNAHLEQNLGLSGNTEDDIDYSLVPSNTLFVDPVTRILYQWRDGVLDRVYSVGLIFDPQGAWDGTPGKVALDILLFSVANEVAVDLADGTNFALTFDADFELQLPANAEVDDVFDILFTASGAGHNVTFAPGFSGAAATDIRVADGARTRLRFTVTAVAVSGGTATAVTVAKVTFAKNDLVDDRGFTYASNADANFAEPQLDGVEALSDDNWTAVPLTGAAGAAGPTGATGPQGAAGADGADPGILLTWSTATADADPGAGAIRANNASLAAATLLYVDKANRAGSDIEAALLALDDSTNTVKGALVLTNPADDAQAIFTLGAVTDATGYVKVAVSGHAGATSFANGVAISFQPSRAGDKGADGAGAGDVVGPASVTDDLPAIFDGTTGKLIKQKTYAAFKTLLVLVKGDVGLGNVDNTSDSTKDAAVATLTNKTLTAPVVNSPTGIVKGDVGLGNVDNTSDATKNAATATLTNKRRTRRLTTTNAPGATPTTNTDNVDVMNFTGLAAAITSMTTNLSGTPVDGDQVEFRFTDNGTGRAITWGASFAATTIALPTTTVASTMLRAGFEWDGAVWRCVGVA